MASCGFAPKSSFQVRRTSRWSIGDLNDPVVLVAVTLVPFVAATMSAAIPANRAASIHPTDALRTD